MPCMAHVMMRQLLVIVVMLWCARSEGEEQAGQAENARGVRRKNWRMLRKVRLTEVSMRSAMQFAAKEGGGFCRE